METYNKDELKNLEKNENLSYESHEKYDSKLIKDHQYDGILELDNDLPPWLMWVFYVTIFFSAIYMVHYHAFDQGKTQDEEYQQELAIAADKYGNTDNSGTPEEITLLTDAGSLAEGEQIYVDKNCASCHGENGEGNAVGPNLTDNYWINGPTPKDVFDIIKHGNLAKGMTPFKDQLTDEKIIKLTSYVLEELQGSNPPNDKAPEGEKYE